MNTNYKYMIPVMKEIVIESSDLICMSADDVNEVDGWDWDAIE